MLLGLFCHPLFGRSAVLSSSPLPCHFPPLKYGHSLVWGREKLISALSRDATSLLPPSLEKVCYEYNLLTCSMTTEGVVSSISFLIFLTFCLPAFLALSLLPHSHPGVLASDSSTGDRGSERKSAVTHGRSHNRQAPGPAQVVHR